MYQMLGSVSPRCMSFESSGLPLAVCLPAITQLFEPQTHPSQGAGRRASRWPRASWQRLRDLPQGLKPVILAAVRHD